MAATYVAPPATSIGAIGWLRRNLFSTRRSSLVTIVLLGLLAWALVLIVAWALNARWGVVTENLRLFLIGQYPLAEAWRVGLSLTVLSVLTGLSAAIYGGGAIRTLATWLATGQLLLALLAFASPSLPREAALALALNAAALWISFAAGLRWPISGRRLTLAWLVALILAGYLLQGGGPLPSVATTVWGGLLLTFVLSLASITLSFPFGVLLALGRRSDMVAVRVLSTAYIEIVRGVPLITILFMAAIMLPLVLPSGLRIDAVVRAVGGLTLFSAAYVAENVRGGLQAIPTGQIEAANAIGLNALQRNLYIVLPQALRSVIPANVGLFISLLKDTTLVFFAGTGLFELLAIGRSVLSRPEWFGAHVEVYVFIATVFFVLCYTMARASYRLERALGVGRR